MHLLLELGKAAQLGRDQHTTGGVQLFIAGKAHEKTLEQRRVLIEAGAREHLVTDRLPRPGAG